MTMAANKSALDFSDSRRGQCQRLYEPHLAVGCELNGSTIQTNG